MYQRVIIDDETEELGVEKLDYKVIEARAQVKADLLSLTREPFSFSVFRKLPYDRFKLRNAKKAWRDHMKASVKGWTRKSDHYTKKVKVW